eukprot:1172198-Pyramimonas_sp.AAC.1
MSYKRCSPSGLNLRATNCKPRNAMQCHVRAGCAFRLNFRKDSKNHRARRARLSIISPTALYHSQRNPDTGWTVPDACQARWHVEMDRMAGMQ